MGWRALGDAAWLYETGGTDPAGSAMRIRELSRRLMAARIPEATDLVASFDSLAVHFEPLDGEKVLAWLATLPPPAADEAAEDDHGRIVEIPVVYGGENGPDLERVAAALGRSTDEVAGLHQSAEYRVAAVGFSPGFPYLTGLPEALRLPRLDTPRRVAAGSVAIAGDQAGIYPFDSPGGWHVLGRTPLELFDPSRAQPALLRPGDRVRFVAVEKLEQRADSQKEEYFSRPGIEVLAAGAFTTVQDPGRPGYQDIGVSPGGVADPVSARVANRLVGNPDEAALLECCMQGPWLRFPEETKVAFVGWQDLRSGMPLTVPAGGELDLRVRMRTLRGYIAVAGGIDVPQVLGSRATDVRAGIGGLQGRALKTGDLLPKGIPREGPAAGAWRVGWPHGEAGSPIELRFLTGMQAGSFDDISRKRFQSSIYRISPASDRTGARLDGPGLECVCAGLMKSQPVVAGSVQVPPDGRPIVLMAERQTIGGYPQIGHVISADLPKLARAWPGTAVSFREVGLEEAREAWRGLMRELAMLQAGLDFLR